MCVRGGGWGEGKWGGEEGVTYAALKTTLLYII